jgi:hypothetical protein
MPWFAPPEPIGPDASDPAGLWLFAGHTPVGTTVVVRLLAATVAVRLLFAATVVVRLLFAGDTVRLFAGHGVVPRWFAGDFRGSRRPGAAAALGAANGQSDPAGWLFGLTD